MRIAKHVFRLAIFGGARNQPQEQLRSREVRDRLTSEHSRESLEALGVWVALSRSSLRIFEYQGLHPLNAILFAHVVGKTLEETLYSPGLTAAEREAFWRRSHKDGGAPPQETLLKVQQTVLSLDKTTRVTRRLRATLKRLRRADPEWFDANIPKFVELSAPEVYAQRDACLTARVPDAVSSVLSRRPVVQVTKGEIFKVMQLKPSVIDRSLYPLLKAALAKARESAQEFALRRLELACEDAIAKGELPSFSGFSQRFRPLAASVVRGHYREIERRLRQHAGSTS